MYYNEGDTPSNIPRSYAFFKTLKINISGYNSGFSQWSYKSYEVRSAISCCEALSSLEGVFMVQQMYKRHAIEVTQ